MSKKKMITISCLLVTSGIIGTVVYKGMKALMRADKVASIYKSYYSLALAWLDIKSAGTRIDEYLHKRNIKTVGIYGMGSLGELLKKELKNTDIKIAYFVDTKAENHNYVEDGIPVIGPSDVNSQELVDLIIITPISNLHEIYETLDKHNIEVEAEPLDEIIYNL